MGCLWRTLEENFKKKISLIQHLRVLRNNQPIINFCIVVFFISSFVSVYIGFKTAITTGSQDFHYSSLKLFIENKNPYQLFIENCKCFNKSQFPTALPQLYMSSFLLGYLNNFSASLIWAILNVLLVFLLGYFLSKATTLKTYFVLFLIASIFWSTPFRNALGNGQLSIYVTSFLTFFLFIKKEGVGKFFVLPLIFLSKWSLSVLFLLKNGFTKKAFVQYFILVALQLLVFFVFDFITNQKLGNSILALLQVYKQLGNFKGMGVVDWNSLENANLNIFKIPFFLISFTGFVLLFFRKYLPEDIFIILLSLTTLCILYHAYYDFTLLSIPLIFVLINFSKKHIPFIFFLLFNWYIYKFFEVLHYNLIGNQIMILLFYSVLLYYIFESIEFIKAQKSNK